jgi:hypothetical protein
MTIAISRYEPALRENIAVPGAADDPDLNDLAFTHVTVSRLGDLPSADRA